MSRFRYRDDLRMIGLFIPIAFTLFLAYSLIVQRLRRDHRDGPRPRAGSAAPP